MHGKRYIPILETQGTFRPFAYYSICLSQTVQCRCYFSLNELFLESVFALLFKGGTTFRGKKRSVSLSMCNVSMTLLIYFEKNQVNSKLTVWASSLMRKTIRNLCSDESNTVEKWCKTPGNELDHEFIQVVHYWLECEIFHNI